MSGEDHDARIKAIMDGAIKKPPYEHVTWAQAPTKDELLAGLEKAREMLRRSERTAICPPAVEEPLRTAVEEAGLSHVITVVANPHLPPDACYVVPTHLVADVPGLIELETQEWDLPGQWTISDFTGGNDD